MSEQEAPKIEFPCRYPIKVMGEVAEDFVDFVNQVMAKHDLEYDPASVTVRASRNGNYQAVTTFITATGKPQLEAIFADLKASGRVKMVL